MDLLTAKLATLSTKEEPTVKDNDSKLNLSQERAIASILSAEHGIRCIQGPPGTGKSTVILEAIKRTVLNTTRIILVASPSNAAVDEVH